MRKPGRPRARKPKCPDHIDASKLPAGCYWDSSYSGHWYTTFKGDDGRQKRRKIADADATLATLYKALEEVSGNAMDTLIWLADKFERSTQFREVSKDMKKDYVYSRKVATTYPTKKPGLTLGDIPLDHWNPPLVQKLIDGIADSRGPSSAKHVYTYLKRVFNWGINRGYCKTNPVQKMELPKERKRRRLPDNLIVTRLVAFAQRGGEVQARTKGACPGYIWIALELAYLCRLRGIEVFALTDAALLDQGVLCIRTKGSARNVTAWNKRLHNCVDAAQDIRAKIQRRTKFPTPISADKRPLLVNTLGEHIKQSTWQSAWRRFMDQAIEAKVITEEERFGLHDMKRRGATDTKGTKSEKMEATGHSSLQMLKVYDMSVPLVEAASD